jgi:hypothetical protein
MVRKITRKKHASEGKIIILEKSSNLIAAIEVTSGYHCAKSGAGRFGIK